MLVKKPRPMTRFFDKLAGKMAQWLLKAGAIEENEKELYEYAVFSFLFSLFPLCLVMVIGGISGMLIEGVLMILPFMLIRKFSGGYHLDSSVVCFVSSTLLLSAALALINIITSAGAYKVFLCAAAVAALQIFVCSPIDSEAGKLSEKERVVFRTIARLMVVVFLPLSRCCIFWELKKLLSQWGGHCYYCASSASLRFYKKAKKRCGLTKTAAER